MAKVHPDYVPNSMSDYAIGLDQGVSEDLEFAVKHGDAKRIPNYAEKAPWPKGAVRDRAHEATRRPTAAEERDEHQSKLYNKYMPDAIESQERYEAKHAEELAKFEAENK